MTAIPEAPEGLRDKPVLVTGASGFMGSHATRLLCGQGRKVRVMLRPSSNTEALDDLPVEIVHGDVSNPASLRAAMTGCSSVFYNVVDPRMWLTDPTPLYRCNVDGLVNAMDAALACGIERFVFTSTMGTLGINPDRPVTEDDPFNWEDRADAYIMTRVKAEREFLKYCREHELPGVALCVANTYGPQDYQPTPHGDFLYHYARGKVPFVLNCGAPVVDIRDAALSTLLAERYGRIGERYIIANEFLSQREFYGLACELGGHKQPWVMPLSVAYAMSWVVEMFCRLLRRKDYLISTKAVFLSDVFRELDNSKARRELHWQPRPVEETVRDAIDWYAAREAGIEAAQGAQ